MKNRPTCVCMVCDEQFTNITDHMLHYMREHDEGYKEPQDRRRRTVTCGACLQPMRAENLVCKCGQVHWSLTETQKEENDER